MMKDVAGSLGGRDAVPSLVGGAGLADEGVERLSILDGLDERSARKAPSRRVRVLPLLGLALVAVAGGLWSVQFFSSELPVEPMMVDAAGRIEPEASVVVDAAVASPEVAEPPEVVAEAVASPEGVSDGVAMIRESETLPGATDDSMAATDPDAVPAGELEAALLGDNTERQIADKAAAETSEHVSVSARVGAPASAKSAAPRSTPAPARSPRRPDDADVDIITAIVRSAGK